MSRSFWDNMHPATLNGVKLGLFAVVTALLLGITYAGTREQIEIAQRQVEQRALTQVVSTLAHQPLDLEDRLPVPASGRAMLNVAASAQIQMVRDSSGDTVAFILPSVAPDGYSGDIRLIVGVDLDGDVTGVRVVEHRETPGLGDKVDVSKSDWILSFAGKSLNNPSDGWAVVKDGGQFDSFTGATITPRAVVRQVRRSLLFFREYRDQLIEESDL